MRKAITLMDLAAYRLGRPARTGRDFARASVTMFAGCEVCGASLAAYNGHPSRTGYVRCAVHIGQLGWPSAVRADRDIFGGRRRR